MSRAWSWRNAILRSGLPATTKHVLMVISCHMNDMGEGCYPSTKRIAELASLSERSVCTHIEEADKAGWLKVKPHGYAGQKWARHEYLPLWPEGTESGSAPLEAAEPRAEGTEPHAEKALNDVQSNISVEHPKEQLVACVGFDAFWELYPRKVSKPHALKAWKANDCSKHFDEVMAGLRRWVASEDWKSRPADKLPYPATWLNGQRWNDQPSAVEGKRLPGEVAIPAVSPEQDAENKREARRRGEFQRLMRLPENNRKTSDQLWEMVFDAERNDNTAEAHLQGDRSPSGAGPCKLRAAPVDICSE